MQQSSVRTGKLLFFSEASSQGIYQSRYAYYLTHLTDCSQRICESNEDNIALLASEIATMTNDHIHLYFHQQSTMSTLMIPMLEGRRGFPVYWGDTVYGSLQVLLLSDSYDHLILPVHLCERLARDCAWCLRALHNERTRLLQQSQKDKELQKKLSSLSSSQRQVLELMAQGHSTRAIADRLQLSKRTIESHQQHIYNTLQVHSQREAVLLAIAGGIMAK